MATLFETSDDELLASVYQKQGRTLDDLPYTPDFEAIFEAVAGGETAVTRAELFHRLHNLRKGGKLPRLGKAREAAPRLSPEHERIVTGLVEAEVGQLSRRDRLPYTDAFDRVVLALNSRAGLSLSPHDVWRVVAKLAK